MTDFTNVSVLVADASADARKVACAALAGFGVGRVVEAADSNAARYRIEADRYDAVMLDFALGETDGADFVRALRRMKDNPNRKVPVLLVSELLDADALAKLETAGIDVLLAKPLSAPDLLVHLTGLVSEPRIFVDSPGYVGPCRRNGRRERITAA